MLGVPKPGKYSLGSPVLITCRFLSAVSSVRLRIEPAKPPLMCFFRSRATGDPRQPRQYLRHQLEDLFGAEEGKSARETI